MLQGPALRFRELVLSLRPSLARACWVVTDRVDDLSDAGLDAWLVATTHLAGDLSRPELAGWALVEIEAEHARWRDGAVVLRTLFDYLDAGYPAVADNDLAWYANLRAFEQRLVSGRACFTPQDLVASQAALYRAQSLWPLTCDVLRELVDLPGTGPMPPCPAAPLVQPQSIRILEHLLDVD